MLTQLSVKNLAIVTQLELNFGHGMHVITGETGAGKSIIIDALNLALGERASPDQIRAHHTQAEVTVSFDLQNLPAVVELLLAQELQADGQCIIRRIINSDGRSRAYLNGHSVTAQQLKALAPHLVHIHGQHQHHALLDSDYQRSLLDAYAVHDHLLSEVRGIYQRWANIKQEIQVLTDSQNQTDKLTLLNYQIQELENLNLQVNELQAIDQKHTQLSKSEELLSTCQNVNSILNGESDSVIDRLHNAMLQLTSLQKITTSLNPSSDLLKQAIINIQEASAEISDYVQKLELDPAQLQTLEQRLSAIHALARKLKVAPELLHEHFQQLRQQRDLLADANQRLEQLLHDLNICTDEYTLAAQKLTVSRKKSATKLSSEIITKLKILEMPNASFEIRLDPLKHQNPTAFGNETINFLVTTNPGQPLAALKKVASGGELSRISLAIQVISAQQMATPTLILDEVDVGISGKTAATVGQLMRELGSKAQLLCITHLPQVASQGHQHLKVEKLQTKNETSTQISVLNQAQRISEIARLMGGVDVSPEALAHARVLLEDVL